MSRHSIQKNEKTHIKINKTTKPPIDQQIFRLHKQLLKIYVVFAPLILADFPELHCTDAHQDI